jgi:hypothetical protein
MARMSVLQCAASLFNVHLDWSKVDELSIAPLPENKHLQFSYLGGTLLKED